MNHNNFFFSSFSLYYALLFAVSMNKFSFLVYDTKSKEYEKGVIKCARSQSRSSSVIHTMLLWERIISFRSRVHDVIFFIFFFFIIFVKLELLSFLLTIPLDHSIKKRKGMRVRKWSKWATDCNSAQFASPGCIACSSTIQMRPRTFLSASIEQRLIERIKKFHAWVMMKNVITKGLRTAWQSSIRKLNSGEWTKNLNSN